MPSGPLLLIIDDEDRVREGLKLVLEPEGIQFEEAPSAEEGLEILNRESVDVVLLDLRLPGMDGLQAMENISRDHPQIPCIMISGHGGIPDAVRAVQLGAYDFIEKPVQPDRLVVTVQRALRHRRLLTDLEAQRDEARQEWQHLVGSSRIMEKLRGEIARAAPSTGWVLIEGENGTGKELVARLIHEGSPRRQRPFIRLNSASIPKELVESELFGYEAGAFTGATKRRKGKLEQAHGGTFFMDEVSDMELSAQAKLLRALGTGEVERLGGGQPVDVDVRLICATNRDLRTEVAAGRFREDLYFRINVLPIRVPPLRDRGGDIQELSEYYLTRFGKENGRPQLRMESDALDLLARYRWPGNVRELRNLMERLVIMHPRDVVTASDLEPHLVPYSAAQSGEPAPSTVTRIPPGGGGTLPGGVGTRPGGGGAPPGSTGTRPGGGGAPPGSTGTRPGGAGVTVGGIHAAQGAAEGAPGDSEGDASVADTASPLKDRLEDAEREILTQVLEKWGWNVTRAADELGVDRATLHRRMRRLGVQRPRP